MTEPEWRDAGIPYVYCPRTKQFAKLMPWRVIQSVAMDCAFCDGSAAMHINDTFVCTKLQCKVKAVGEE